MGSNPVETSVPSLKAYYAEALAEAREWHADAILTGVQVAVCDENAHLFYLFDSPGSPQEGLTVGIEIMGTEQTLSSEQFALPQGHVIDPIVPLLDSILDSQDALDLALNHGVSEFIGRHPGADEILIQLKGLSGSAAERLGLESFRLAWRVSLRSLPTTAIEDYFDPFTGEFLGSIVRE
jgi:hypothetical protein